jgi:hypothetical protein
VRTFADRPIDPALLDRIVDPALFDRHVDPVIFDRPVDLALLNIAHLVHTLFAPCMSS